MHCKPQRKGHCCHTAKILWNKKNISTKELQLPYILGLIKSSTSTRFSPKQHHMRLQTQKEFQTSITKLICRWGAARWQNIRMTTFTLLVGERIPSLMLIWKNNHWCHARKSCLLFLGSPKRQRSWPLYPKKLKNCAHTSQISLWVFIHVGDFLSPGFNTLYFCLNQSL